MTSLPNTVFITCTPYRLGYDCKTEPMIITLVNHNLLVELNIYGSVLHMGCICVMSDAHARSIHKAEQLNTLYLCMFNTMTLKYLC